MGEIRAGRDYAVVIGDIVGSRTYADQHVLFGNLRGVLERVNTWVESAHPMQMTVGDEFQGAYEKVSTALEAVLLTRLALRGDFGVRFGVAWGAISTYDVEEAPRGQSGEAWWRAREALDHVARVAAKQQWPRTLHTAFAGGSSEFQATINAFLLCHDELLGKMDEKDLRITLGLFRGERQEDVARELGISQPSVARRQVENGSNAVFRAYEQLRGLTP